MPRKDRYTPKVIEPTEGYWPEFMIATADGQDFKYGNLKTEVLEGEVKYVRDGLPREGTQVRKLTIARLEPVTGGWAAMTGPNTILATSSDKGTMDGYVRGWNECMSIRTPQ